MNNTNMVCDSNDAGGTKREPLRVRRPWRHPVPARLVNGTGPGGAVILKRDAVREYLRGRQEEANHVEATCSQNKHSPSTPPCKERVTERSSAVATSQQPSREKSSAVRTLQVSMIETSQPPRKISCEGKRVMKKSVVVRKCAPAEGRAVEKSPVVQKSAPAVKRVVEKSPVVRKCAPAEGRVMKMSPVVRKCAPAEGRAVEKSPVVRKSAPAVKRVVEKSPVVRKCAPAEGRAMEKSPVVRKSAPAVKRVVEISPEVRISPQLSGQWSPDETSLKLAGVKLTPPRTDQWDPCENSPMASHLVDSYNTRPPRLPPNAEETPTFYWIPLSPTDEPDYSCAPLNDPRHPVQQALGPRSPTGCTSPPLSEDSFLEEPESNKHKGSASPLPLDQEILFAGDKFDIRTPSWDPEDEDSDFVEMDCDDNDSDLFF